jgi:hypothetical protein
LMTTVTTASSEAGCGQASSGATRSPSPVTSRVVLPNPAGVQTSVSFRSAWSARRSSSRGRSRNPGRGRGAWSLVASRPSCPAPAVGVVAQPMGTRMLMPVFDNGS